MDNDFKRKNVRLIVICVACILAVVAVIYGFFRLGSTSGGNDSDNANMQTDPEAMSLEGTADKTSGGIADETAKESANETAGETVTGDDTMTKPVLDEAAKEAALETFKDKTLSVLGDSISTYEGWIPDGYVDFFPIYGELSDVDETWWKLLIDDMEMQFCANSSSAGSTCVGDSLSTDDPKFACSNYRIDELIGKGGIFPDIIIVYMGTNDLLTNVPIGENDGTQPVEEGNIETFSDAYSLILDKLESQYPGAQIFCCTLAQIGDWGNDKPFATFVNHHELTAEDYGRQIEIIAKNRGFGVIDLLGCGITIDNMQRYTADGVHLNPEGMKLVRDAAKEAIISSVY